MERLAMQNKTVKIIAVVAILFLIAAVWMFKTYFDNQATLSNGLGSSATSSANDANNGATPAEVGESSVTASSENADSPIYSDKSIDMDAYVARGLPIILNFSGSG
jgi:hypothetical protein